MPVFTYRGTNRSGAAVAGAASETTGTLTTNSLSSQSYSRVAAMKKTRRHRITSTIGVMLITGQLLPSVNEVPADFSAQLLWRFRTVSIGMNLVLWSALGILYGLAAERVLNDMRRMRGR